MQGLPYPRSIVPAAASAPHQPRSGSSSFLLPTAVLSGSGDVSWWPAFAVVFSNISRSGRRPPGFASNAHQTSSSRRTEDILAGSRAAVRLLRPLRFRQASGSIGCASDAPGRCLYPFVWSFEHSHPHKSDVTPRPPPASLSFAYRVSVLTRGLPPSLTACPALLPLLHRSAATSVSCARPPGPRTGLQAGKLRDAASVAPGVPGTRTALQRAAQTRAGWDGQ